MRPPETRHSLIVRLKDSRNDLAWTEFVCAYEPFLLRLVRRQGTPERHVADVTQQLLIAIAKSVDGWKADGKTASFRRWLGCVARNVVIKFMVRERKQITGQGGSDFLTTLCRESAGTATGRQRGGSQAVCTRSSGDGRDSASKRHADSGGAFQRQVAVHRHAIRGM